MAKLTPQTLRILAIIALENLFPPYTGFFLNVVSKSMRLSSQKEIFVKNRYISMSTSFFQGGGSARIAHVWRRPWKLIKIFY